MSDKRMFGVQITPRHGGATEDTVGICVTDKTVTLHLPYLPIGLIKHMAEVFVQPAFFGPPQLSGHFGAVFELADAAASPSGFLYLTITTYDPERAGLRLRGEIIT